MQSMRHMRRSLFKINMGCGGFTYPVPPIASIVAFCLSTIIFHGGKAESLSSDS
jgi:hypothetical protein